MPISFDLTGKNILITGASSGIGRACAVAAAQAGAFVILAARNEERLRETAVLCGEKSAVEPCDLTADLDKLPHFVMRLAKKYGTFSGLVNSAGISTQQPVKTIRASNLLEQFSVNCAAAVMLVKGLTGFGVHNKNGASVVLLSSVSGLFGVPGQLGYCASKGALELAAKTLALELVPLKIRVNTIAPAMIKTPMLDGVIQTGTISWDNHPSGLGEPEDVAAGAVYLLSDAAKFITGTTLTIDGGYTAQ